MGKKVWIVSLIMILILKGAHGAREINKRIDSDSGGGGADGSGGNGGNGGRGGVNPSPPLPGAGAGAGAPPGAGAGAPPGAGPAGPATPGGGAPSGGPGNPGAGAGAPPATWLTCSLGAAAHLLPCLPSLGFNFSGQNVGGNWGWSPQACCNGIANINPNCVNAILNFLTPFLGPALSGAVGSCS